MNHDLGQVTTPRHRNSMSTPSGELQDPSTRVRYPLPDTRVQQPVEVNQMVIWCLTPVLPQNFSENFSEDFLAITGIRI